MNILIADHLSWTSFATDPTDSVETFLTKNLQAMGSIPMMVHILPFYFSMNNSDTVATLHLLCEILPDSILGQC